MAHRFINSNNRGTLFMAPYLNIADKLYTVFSTTQPILILMAYIAFLYSCYGTDPSSVFLNADQAFFKSMLHSLEKEWHLFPTTLENVSNISGPYHHMDSQLKWIVSLLFSSHHAIIIVNSFIFLFLLYALLKLRIPFSESLIVFLLTVSLLKLPTPNMVFDILNNPFDFKMNSDIFGNTNSTLAFATIAFCFRKSFLIRVIIYSLVFYIKSPAVPAFIILEIYLLFFSKNDSQKPYHTVAMLQLALALTIIAISGLLFFNLPFEQVSKLTNSGKMISLHIRTEINWLENGLLLYDVILFLLVLRASKNTSNPLLIALYKLAVVILLLYDSIGIIQFNISNAGQVFLFIRYMMLIIILNEIHRDHNDRSPQAIFTILVLSIFVFNCYFLIHFTGALMTKNYHRFTEYLDNTDLIEITSPITDENAVVAYNTIDSAIRKNKQLQLCGIIKNPIWVSNLAYVTANAQPFVERDWTLLLNALKGQAAFPGQIQWLILNKSERNYDITAVEKQFSLVKESQTHLLYTVKHQPTPQR